MSSEAQIIKQVRKLLREAPWPAAPQALIFGASVYLLADIGDKPPEPNRFPCAYVLPMEATADELEPDVRTTQVGVVMFAHVENDPHGEAALVGGPSMRGAQRAGHSEGRGLLEIEAAVLPRLRTLTHADGAGVLVVPLGAPSMITLADGRVALYRAHRLSAVASSVDEFPAPVNLEGDVSVPGQVTLAWDLPPPRFDLLRVKLRRAVGSTAPATHDAGFEVPLSGNLATSVVVTLAAGVHSFSLFAMYDDVAPTPATERQVSEQVRGSTRTVTVT